MLVETAPSSIPPVVTITNLVKQFGRFAALRGVTAEFQPAKLYAILGDNGAGKSTLLRVMAGLMQPTRGAIAVLGSSDLRAIAPRMPNTSYLINPEHHKLLDDGLRLARGETG